VHHENTATKRQEGQEGEFDVEHERGTRRAQIIDPNPVRPFRYRAEKGIGNSSCSKDLYRATREKEIGGGEVALKNFSLKKNKRPLWQRCRGNIGNGRNFSGGETKGSEGSGTKW